MREHPKFEHIEKKYEEVQIMANKYWISEDLFSYKWWLLATLMVILWLIWFKLVDKRKLVEILLGGSLISIVTLLLDLIGLNLGLWNYTSLLFAGFYPTLVPVDLVVIPVTYMLIYQYKVTLKSFFLTSIVVSGVYSFIAEPIFNAMDIYRMNHWRYIYSFPIYIVLFLFIKWIVDLILNISNQPEKELISVFPGKSQDKL
jgi:hypothetical protein